MSVLSNSAHDPQTHHYLFKTQTPIPKESRRQPWGSSELPELTDLMFLGGIKDCEKQDTGGTRLPSHMPAKKPQTPVPLKALFSPPSNAY